MMDMVNLAYFTFNFFSERCYILYRDGGRSVIVDPGFSNEAEEKAFYGFFEQNGTEPGAVILTHAHPDHIWGVKSIQDRYGVPVYMNPKEEPVLEYASEMAARFGVQAPRTDFRTTPVSGGESLTIEGIGFETIDSPGHTSGGLCWYDREDNILFSGDTLFAGSIGRTDFKYGEYDDLIVSIMENIMGLDADVEVHPGHGGPTTIGWERTHNPFLEPFNEKEEIDPDADPIEING